MDLYIIARSRKEYEDWLSCHPNYNKRNTKYVAIDEDLRGIDLTKVKLLESPIFGRLNNDG